MAKNIRWQIPFVSLQGVQYRIDIYDEGTFTPVQLAGGPTPFVTVEDASDDFFAPVRSQTGTIQVCTAIPGGGTITLNDLLPANNIARPVVLASISGSTTTIEWQGFLSCEAYSQDYTAVPQILDIPVISVLEAMKSMELSSYWFDQVSGETISAFISDIFTQVVNEAYFQLTAVYSQAANDILSKYIFASQYFTYETNESTGNITYIHTAASLYEIFEDICRFMGWCLREVGSTFYFERIGSDELGMTTANMSALSWRGKDHKKTLLQGVKSVSVEATLKEFETSFEMPICPTSGLSEKNYYSGISAMPQWYYDKCTQTTIGRFSTNDISKAFLARFYGIRSDSSAPWDRLYEDIGFNNCIYLVGQKYEDASYSKLCTIISVTEFSVICGISGTTEDAGHFILKLKDEIGATGYIRCGLKYLGYYYSGITGTSWNTNPTSSFKVDMENGNGELRIDLPRVSSKYTFVNGWIELYLYNDFDNGKTSAIISDISIEYEPPFRKNTNDAKSNKYLQNLSGYRDAVKLSLNLASSFNNRNALSHIYEVYTYWFGPESMDYLQPITTITYNLAGGLTETRRPEVDLLNRLAAYYGAARQRLELIVAHPTAAPLPLLKLNGINDGKVYLPLSETRDWQSDICQLTCFETPTT